MRVVVVLFVWVYFVAKISQIDNRMDLYTVGQTMAYNLRHYFSAGMQFLATQMFEIRLMTRCYTIENDLRKISS